MQEKNSTYYGHYLQLDKLLNAQKPLSEAHDETLFIIVHQVYELWFKQIHFELENIIGTFQQAPVQEKALGGVVARLQRIEKILQLFPLQFDILETMNPIDFLEFRNLLVPASGFQSVQFRKVEIMLGLRAEQRAKLDSQFFMGTLTDEDKKSLVTLGKKPSLFNLIEQWLERMPFAKTEEFNFWKEFKSYVREMLDDEETLLHSHPNEEEKEALANNLSETRETFESLLDPKKHASLVKQRKRDFSHQASLNALFIFFFRDEPILAWPFCVLRSLMNIDEHLSAWRYRHSLMAHRMLGDKIGTGGSSGHRYLKMTAEKSRVFKDLFNLSSFLVPKSFLPKIPESLKEKMSFSSALK